MTRKDDLNEQDSAKPIGVDVDQQLGHIRLDFWTFGLDTKVAFDQLGSPMYPFSMCRAATKRNWNSWAISLMGAYRRSNFVR